MTRRAVFAVVAAALSFSAYARWKRIKELRAWDKVFAYGLERARELGLDRMTEEAAEVYVDRAIHEHRAEQRKKERGG